MILLLSVQCCLGPDPGPGTVGAFVTWPHTGCGRHTFLEKCLCAIVKCQPLVGRPGGPGGHQGGAAELHQTAQCPCRTQKSHPLCSAVPPCPVTVGHFQGRWARREASSVAVAPTGASHGYAHVAPSALSGLGSRRMGMEEIPRGADAQATSSRCLFSGGGSPRAQLAPPSPGHTGVCDVTTCSKGHVPIERSHAVSRGREGSSAAYAEFGFCVCS